MRTGKLAHAAGISPDSLRYYERRGVLPKPARDPNGYRRYPDSALGRVQLIRRALALGFTLEELARILIVRDRGGAPCRQVRDLAASKLSEIEQRLQEMQALRREFRALLKDWDRRLSRTGFGRARLLESLSAPEGRRSPRPSRSTFQVLKPFQGRKTQK